MSEVDICSTLENEEEPPPTNRVVGNGIDLKELVKDGSTFELDPEILYNDSGEHEDNMYDDADLLLQHNLNALNLDDCDESEDKSDKTSFQKLALKMIDLDKTGKVRKRIMQEGEGEVVPPNALVTVHYDAYAEYQDEPFDSTYLNKRPRTFHLRNSDSDKEVILGLEIAVSSMKRGEISQFLIDPDYAYGKFGFPPRIPSNSKILFVVEMIKFVDSGAIGTSQGLSIEDKTNFEKVYPVAKAYHQKGNDLHKKNPKAAIKNYNSAVNYLENARLANIEDQEKQQKLLMKLYSNLAYCFNKIDMPKRACVMCNRAGLLCGNGSMNVTPKILFHHGRALLKLGEFKESMNKLRQAQRLEPNNQDIANEMSIVDKKLKESLEKEKLFANLCFQKPKSKAKIVEIDERINQEVKKFLHDPDWKEWCLPAGLTDSEIESFKVEAERQGLSFKMIDKGCEGSSFCISKK